jgi:hypothetical protein
MSSLFAMPFETRSSGSEEHRFPSLIFFVIDPRDAVVLASMHASRGPESWLVAKT